MNLDKFVNSKTYGFIDWILRLLIINLLVIITSILFFVPAFSSGYSTIKYFRSKKHGNTFKIFFTFFKRNFLKTLLCGLIVTIIGGILLIALWFYFALSENFGILLAYYFILFSLFILIIIFFHLPMIIEYFNFRILDNLRFGFYVSIRFISLTLILIIIWILSGLMIVFLLPLWTMIGLSGPLYLVDVFSRRYYDIISQQGSNRDDLEERKEKEKENG